MQWVILDASFCKTALTVAGETHGREGVLVRMRGESDPDNVWDVCPHWWITCYHGMRDGSR